MRSRNSPQFEPVPAIARLAEATEHGRLGAGFGRLRHTYGNGPSPQVDADRGATLRIRQLGVCFRSPFRPPNAFVSAGYGGAPSRIDFRSQESGPQD